MKTHKSLPKRFRVSTAASLGAAIRHYRRLSGVSQIELAELTGIHRSYLSSLERGRETEHLRRILRILNRLGLRVSIEASQGDD